MGTNLFLCELSGVMSKFCISPIKVAAQSTHHHHHHRSQPWWSWTNTLQHFRWPYLFGLDDVDEKAWSGEADGTNGQNTKDRTDDFSSQKHSESTEHEDGATDEDEDDDDDYGEDEDEMEEDDDDAWSLCVLNGVALRATGSFYIQLDK